MTLSFIHGASETAALMRAHDWTVTPLGNPPGWSPTLKTLVTTMLASSEPMCIAWGPRHLMLYNHAYAELMGERHPALARAFAEIWPEKIKVLGPKLAEAYAGTASKVDDLGLVLGRDGRTEEAHFAVSLTPVRDAEGEVGGIFCVCNDITERVLAHRQHAAKVEQFRELFEQSASYAAVLRGPEHQFELANPKYRALAGGRALIGHSIRDALPELRDQGVFALLQQVYRSGEPVTGSTVSIRLVAGLGGLAEERVLDFVYQPIRDADGQVTGIFAEGFDITETRRMHDALRESEERLRFTVESATDYAIMTTDNEGRITSWSSGAAAAFQWTRDEVLGRSYTCLFVADDQAAEVPAKELATAMRDGLSSDERWHQRKDGSLVFMNGSVRPLHDASGRQLGFIKMARDETERRRQNDALHRALSLRAGLVELGDRLRDLGDIEQMARAAADITGRSLAVSRCGYGLVDAVAETVAVEHDYGSVPGVGGLEEIWRFADFGTYFDALRGGETVAVADATTDARIGGRSDPFKSIDAVSFIALPIVEHGRFVALFYLADVAVRAWPAEDIAFARAVADRLWAATERLRAEQRLRTLNATLEQQVEERTQERDRVWNLSQDLMAVVGTDGVFRAANPAWERVLGFSPAEVVGQHIADLTYGDDQPEETPTGGVDDPTAAGQRRDVPPRGPALVPIAFENRYRHESGGFRWLGWTATTAENGLIYVNGRDITEERAAKDALSTAEDALRQSQKMEAIGQLTGGIAHDFNNILTGILGSLDIMRRRIESGRAGEIGRFMDAAHASAQRAASLTHRLLAFARRQSLDTKPSDVNQLVAGMEELLHRTLGEQVGLRIELAADLWSALADPHQLESAILNLAINARDAMPDGGLLTIETQNARLDTAFVSLLGELAPGDYVAISVSDTGVGMSAEVMARAFDPFFTTKPIGQGTGLGLSMVYGFAKQSKGHVRIQSETGHGSTIRLYLPRARGVNGGGGVAAATTVGRGDGETVLVVEDDESVRLLITAVLTELGYRYLEAAGGGSAIPIIQSGRRIDLLISDVGLPGMNGRQLAEVARQMRPGLKVLFVTGYAEMAASRGGFLGEGMDMLTKPFALETLATKVRAMLED